MTRYRIASLILAVLATCISPVAGAQTKYVTDRLEVTLRSGTSTQNAIVRMLRSGSSVEVLEEDSESGYARVRTSNGTEGWVLSRFLVNQPVARDQLSVLERRHTDLSARFEQVSAENEQLNHLKNESAAANNQLDANNQELTNELERVRRAAANTLAIDAANKQLTDQVNGLNIQMEQVQQENLLLRDRRNRDWFIAGSAVLLFGLLLGLIIPRIRWKRRSSWGSGF
jgi:SH3 domain protein